MGYQSALELQRRVHQEVADGARPDTLLLMEHPHVYTLGRRGEASDILVDAVRLAEIGAEVHYTDRGGQVTYHGPGQLVGYPILNLRRRGGGPLRYVRALEETISGTLARLGLAAGGDGRPTGVWVGHAKIAAIGVKISRGVSLHGFALNVDTDLSYFDHIVPCGMPDSRVTSVSAELGRPVSIDQVVPTLTSQFGRVFGMGMVLEPAGVATSAVDTPTAG
jgi:lipoate-protein ligase B